MNFNQNLYPPDGYVFTDLDGTLHRGDSWRDLFFKVKEYRQRNGRAPGDVEREVSDQHCGRYPGLCHHDPPPPPVQTPGNTLNARVLNWFSNKLAEARRIGEYPKVSVEEAKRRSEICARCPKQLAFSTACEACVAAVKSSRKTLLGDAGSVHQGLHPCNELGEDCVTSIHLSEPPANEPGLPENCWRRA